MTIACVMAIHRREAVTRETIRMLRLQTVPVDIVLVGDSPIERAIAEETGCLFVEHDNEPLSWKYQAGVEWARELEPDALLIEGSDSWLSPTWVEWFYPKLGDDCHLVGRSGGLNLWIGEGPMLAYLRHYRARRDPVGAGRLFSRAALEVVDWQLFTESRKRFLDNMSYRVIQGTGLKTMVFNPDVPCLVGVRSSAWAAHNAWRPTRYKKHQHRVETVADPEGWLEARFPEALAAAGRLREELGLC